MGGICGLLTDCDEQPLGDSGAYGMDMDRSVMCVGHTTANSVYGICGY